jgi:hypothetical protein
MFYAKKFILRLYLGYETIYRQIGRDQSESGNFLLLVDLEVLSEFYLDSDPSLDIWYDHKESYPDFTGNRIVDHIIFRLKDLSWFYRDKTVDQIMTHTSIQLEVES